MRITLIVLLALLGVMPRPARAQQFNSDNYLSKPTGVATVILTHGQRNSMFMNTFSLLPNWEFTAAAYLYDEDSDPNTDDGYSTSLYAKYMFYENKAKTGGFAMKTGTGLDPGYLDVNNRLNDAFRTWWTNAPITLPFDDGKLSVDVMPGLSVSKDIGPNKNLGWSFTYATRAAWSPVSAFPPTWSLVGEITGAEGAGTAPAEYRVGPRWEPNAHVVVAVTYDAEFKGSHGAGWEAGLMLFTPPFFGAGVKP